MSDLETLTIVKTLRYTHVLCTWNIFEKHPHIVLPDNNAREF